MDLYAQLTQPQPAASGAGRFPGVVVAVVTNNKDPDKLGRVRVRYPWLSEDMESDWARVVGAGAGKERGLVAVPQVDDEVLVAFEHGLIDLPYVLGGLWNPIDKLPAPADRPGDVRQLRSRSGHTIKLDDTAQAEKVEITAANGSTTIVLDSANNTLTIRTGADLVLESRNGAVTITGQTVEVKANRAFKVEATEVEVAAKTTLKQSAQGAAELRAGGPLTVRGATVNIN